MKLAEDSQLALLGGTPICETPWPVTNTIGPEEKREVLEVLESGVLSGFRAGAGEEFLGGVKIRRLEREWAARFESRHAVSFNSLTSGLIAAIGAIGIGPGDEVILPPLTMSASATSVLFYGGVPVFADIEPDTFGLDPRSVRQRITSRTRAILVVHLFGCPADMEGLLAVARDHRLPLIEDCAQAPGATYRGRGVGTLGDMGGFSLNIHKTIHCGEGGVLITDSDEWAQRLRLIRNHGEVAVEGLGLANWTNIFGGNFRMTELEAAVACAQLKKLDGLTEHQIHLASYLTAGLSEIPGLRLPPPTQEGTQRVYYVYPMRFDRQVWGISRELFLRAVQAEGVPLRADYQRPIYLEPIFRRRCPQAFCPVAEKLHQEELVFGRFCRWPLSEHHMDRIVAAFRKVWAARSELQRCS